MAEDIIRKNISGMDEAELDSIKKLMKRYVDNFVAIENRVKSEFQGTKIKTHVEPGFRIPLAPNCMIMTDGFIDRADVYENGDTTDIHIIDNKTDRINEAGEMDDKGRHYLPQLMVYSRALNMLMRHPGKKMRVAGAYLYFLDCGEYRKVEFSDGDVDRVMKDMEEKAKAVSVSARMEEYERRKGQRCERCSYRKVCI